MPAPRGLEAPKYEVLPFGTVHEQAAQLDEPVRLTITTSPKHGIDRSLEFAGPLRKAGHGVTLHLAARMLRDAVHLETILERCRELGIDDLFVIGGDSPEPLGPYTGAGDVLDLIASHPLRPATIGIAGYPEGHPLIPPEVLDEVLAEKARVADYVVTQLCFDAAALQAWVTRVYARGIELPLFIGAPGPIDRRRLLEISMRIGVGPSLRYLRKQRGLTQLFRSPTYAATRFYDRSAPLLRRSDLNIVGFHFFTFNELTATVEWQRRHAR
jgi:methylenetetrahydrofolate reductase (NADPH)